MKKFGSIILLALYALSLVQVLVPVLSFHANHEYIKNHLCRSLFEAGLDDCDGFCFLRKNIDAHHGHDEHHHMPEATPPKVPFVYVLTLINDSKPIGPDFKKEFPAFDILAERQFFADITPPPPRV